MLPLVPLMRHSHHVLMLLYKHLLQLLDAYNCWYSDLLASDLNRYAESAAAQVLPWPHWMSIKILLSKTSCKSSTFWVILMEWSNGISINNIVMGDLWVCDCICVTITCISHKILSLSCHSHDYQLGYIHVTGTLSGLLSVFFLFAQLSSHLDIWVCIYKPFQGCSEL